MKKSFLAAVLLAVCAALFAEGLSTEVIKKLNSNVYEVVVKKIKDDPITYEKELPYDKLSYKERTDEYDSIGTAFYMQDGSFYTAFHVFGFYYYSQLTDFYIRGSDGKVYAVDMVKRFSSDRDFVEFSVKNFSGDKKSALKFETNCEVNTAVYSVGNAQGEGIIIRDGLLTSQTPEDRDGEWNWLRFSAAANPGNSGGPLINAQGDVVGIIVKKNSTENLNYALPVAELDKIPAGKGVLHERHWYRLPNISSERYIFEVDGEIDLPKNFTETRNAATDILVETTKAAFADLSSKYVLTGSESFAKNLDSDVMNDSYAPPYPLLIARQDNGKWGAYYPDDLEVYKLDDNGYIQQGHIAGLNLAFVQKGDNETVESMIKSPKKLMDNIIKGSGIYRSFAGEQIKIHSFGEAASSSKYCDSLGRTWLVNSWEVPFCDLMLLSYSLPLPSGIFVMYKYSDTNDIKNGFNYDIPYTCDFILPLYEAKFREWKEYLSLPAELYPRHEFLAAAQFSYDAQSTDLSFGVFNASFKTDVFTASDDDYLEIGFEFKPDAERGVVLNIESVSLEVDENKPNHAYYSIVRTKKVSQNASKAFKDGWQVLKNRASPYNETALEKEGKTLFCGIVAQTEDYIDCCRVIQTGSKKKTIKKLYQKVKKAFGY